jgi:hypothetical protein
MRRHEREHDLLYLDCIGKDSAAIAENSFSCSFIQDIQLLLSRQRTVGE